VPRYLGHTSRSLCPPTRKIVSVPTTDAPPSPEALAALQALFEGMDRHFSESSERQRFMRTANGLTEGDQQLLQAVLAGRLARDAAREAAAAAHSPLRVAHALLELETTIRKSKDLVLLDFIFTLLQSKKVTSGLSRVWVFPWEQALVLNKQLTGEQLRFVWQNRKEHYAKELVPESARQLARHPQCPPDVLEEMLPLDDAMLRKSIAMHPNPSAHILRFFLQSPRKPERLNLALSRHAGSDALLSLLRDKHEEVRRAARKNLSQRFESLAVDDAAIAAAMHALGGDRIGKPATQPTAKAALPPPAFKPYQAKLADAEQVLAMDSAQRKRVADATFDAPLLRLLASDTSKAVRRAVARRSAVGMDALTALARDEDTETSNNALQAIASLSPDATAEDLLSPEALEAAHRHIAEHVAQNSLAPYYEEKFNAQQRQDFARALLVAQYTRNPLIQLMLVKDLQAIPPTSTARWDLLAAAAANRHLCEPACRKIVVDLQFGGFGPLQRCRSATLLKDLLQNGLVEPHYRSTIEDRLLELSKQ